MTGLGKGNKIEVLETVSYPHSVGVFYTTFTQWLGFPHYGDEYKVMGLAPYGQPTHLEQLRKVIKFKDNGLFELDLKYFDHPSKGVNMVWEGGIPAMDSLYSEALLNEFGPARKADEPLSQDHKDWATSVQRITEELIYHLLTHLQQKQVQMPFVLQAE